MTHTSPRKAAAGNALLIVLIGIALFAALMFTLSRSGRYDTGTVEQTAMLAQQITAYADKINGAVQNVMLENGCLDTQVSFENSTASGYTNASAPDKCKIFNSSGGGMIYQTPPAEAVDTASAAAKGGPNGALAGSYLFYGNSCVDNAGTGPTDNGTGPTCSASSTDLIFIMPWVTKDVCEQINQIATNSTNIPTDNGDATFSNAKFTGDYTNNHTLKTGSTTYSSGCFQDTAANPGAGYHFYEVLLAR